MIELIIFDAEGVVIDTESVWDQAQEELLGRRGLAYDRSRIKHLLSGKSLHEGTRILKTEYGLREEVEQLSQERQNLVQQQLSHSVQFITGFPSFYRRIQTLYKTCIGTAMPEDLLAIADRRLGLTKLFGGNIFSLAAVSYRSKPHPDLFLHAAEQLQAKPANCLVIEDAPHGLEAARRAGMKCVGLTTTYDPRLLAHADAVVDSFDQIDVSVF